MSDIIPYVNADENGRKAAELLLDAAESQQLKKHIIFNYAKDKIIPALQAHIEGRSGRFERALSKIGYDANKSEAGLLERDVLDGKLVPTLDGLVYNVEHPTINSDKSKYLMPSSHKKAALLASVIFLTVSVAGCLSNPFASDNDEPANKIIIEQTQTPQVGDIYSDETNTNIQNPIPTIADGDKDYLPDDLEALIGTDLNNYDTDGDKLSDGEEWFVYRTNPLLADTDSDYFMDGFEAKYWYEGWGFNPLVAMTENDFKRLSTIFQARRDPVKGWIMPDAWRTNIDASLQQSGIQALDPKLDNQDGGTASDFLELYTNILKVYQNELNLFDSRDDHCVKPFEFLPYCNPEICLPPVTSAPKPYCAFWDIGRQCGQNHNVYNNRMGADDYIHIWFVGGPIAKPGYSLDLVNLRGNLDFGAMAHGKTYLTYLLPDYMPFSNEPIDTQTEVIKYLRFYTYNSGRDLRCYNLVWVSGEMGKLVGWPNPTCLNGGCQPSSNIPPGNPPVAV